PRPQAPDRGRAGRQPAADRGLRRRRDHRRLDPRRDREVPGRRSHGRPGAGDRRSRVRRARRDPRPRRRVGPGRGARPAERGPRDGRGEARNHVAARGLMTQPMIPIAPPSPLLLPLEGRAWLEFAALAPAWPLLRRAPRGDGHPVLVLPGWLASDWSTRALRGFLRARGYYAHG